MPATAIPASPPARPSTAITVTALAATALAAAVLPVVFGFAFLASALAHRPLMAVLARRWPWLTGGPPEQDSPQTRQELSRLTTVWGAAFLAIGAIQGIGAVLAGLPVTNPASLTVRTLFALAALGALSTGTAAHLRHRRADADQAAAR